MMLGKLTGFTVRGFGLSKRYFSYCIIAAEAAEIFFINFATSHLFFSALNASVHSPFSLLSALT